MTPPGRKAEVVAWQWRLVGESDDLWGPCRKDQAERVARDPEWETRELIPAQSLSDMQARLDAYEALLSRWLAIEAGAWLPNRHESEKRELQDQTRTLLSRDATTTEEPK